MYHEFAGDPIIQGLAFEDQRHYVMVLCFKAAGLLDRDMPSVDVRHAIICKALGLDTLAGSEARRRLSEFGLVGDDWQPGAWERRQFKSDDVTARTRKFKAAQKSEKELNTDSDTDTEGNVPGNVPETFPRKQPKRATGIPDDFAVDDDLTKFATDRLPNVDVPELLIRFKAFHAGKGTVSKDWRASWRTYVGNATKFGYPTIVAAQAHPKKVTRYDSRGRVIDE
jgi:hypothetical protein